MFPVSPGPNFFFKVLTKVSCKRLQKKILRKFAVS